MGMQDTFSAFTGSQMSCNTQDGLAYLKMFGQIFYNYLNLWALNLFDQQMQRFLFFRIY